MITVSRSAALRRAISQGQRGDVVAVIVLAYLGPDLVGNSAVSVGEPAPYLGERERGAVDLVNGGELAPSGDRIEPDGGPVPAWSSAGAPEDRRAALASPHLVTSKIVGLPRR